MEVLPEDCIAHILSFGSPLDACRSAVVALLFRDAAESEALWNKFLPLNHQEIISRIVCPFSYKSKKELFFKLSTTPLLIDGGLKTFSIDRATGKKCYMLSARSLYIAWSTNPLFWCWKPFIRSRFAEVVELRMTSWLEIEGKINSRILSKNTHYGAYLIVEVVHNRAFGLDILPFEVSIELGEFQSRGTIILSHKRSFERVCRRNKVEELLRSKFRDEIYRVSHKRKDGWLEIELGEFYNDGIYDKNVKIRFRDINGVHLKGGLVVEGIEIRPVK